MPWTVLRVRFEAERRQVQFLLGAPSFESCQAKSYKEVTGRTYPWRVTDFQMYYRELGEWLNQQIANLSFRNGCVGSNPTLSAIIMLELCLC